MTNKDVQDKDVCIIQTLRTHAQEEVSVEEAVQPQKRMMRNVEKLQGTLHRNLVSFVETH